MKLSPRHWFMSVKLDIDNLPDEQSWIPLRFYGLYRLVLASLLFLLFISGVGPSLLGKTHVTLYGLTSAAYLLFSIIGLILAWWRRPAFINQVYLLLFVDIVCITLLMHASGGISSGLGILLVVSLAGGSLLVQGRIAMLFASLASCAVLGEQVYADLTNTFPATAYTQAGLLGMAFFATAIVIQRLALRIRESENLTARHAEEIQRLARLNEHIVREMQAGIVALGRDGRIQLINNAAREMLDIDQDVDKVSLNTVAPGLFERLVAWRANHQATIEPFHPSEDTRSVTPQFIPLDDTDNPEVVIILEDSAQLAQHARQLTLAALGRLTASIAHEIRNPLGAISHAGQLLNESPHLQGADRRLTEIIHTHSRRINAIVEDVLRLSRQAPAQTTCIAFREWLDNYLQDFCINRSLTEQELSTRIQPDDLQVYMDPNHLRQVLCNLVENALRHAVPADDGESSVQIIAGLLDDGVTPFIEVIDNGPGVTEDEAGQLFEPFYTTRSDGTGLGLYIARNLCEYNQARLDYYPRRPRGSCFRITFKTCKHD